MAVLAATNLDDVEDVLIRAEQAVELGNWVAGWVAYEAAPAFDPALVVVDGPTGPFDRLPLAWFGVFRSRGPTEPTTRKPYEIGPWTPTVTEPEFVEAIDEIRDRILRGYTYQVNHTFRSSAQFDGDVLGLYHDLTHSQNAGYGALIDSGEWAVTSASPELFFEWRGGVITSRPMKGTTRRGLDIEDDEKMSVWLAESEKNRAENLMIVDMVRNDLGRIADIGSVQVPDLFTTEKYDTVWQLTSTVTAQPRPKTTLVDVFSALFPSASITGAPKVATMDVIRGLERSPRGVYCGAVGFGGPTSTGQPHWAFNVAIRTVTVDRRSATAWYGTGGGITYDSTAEDEYAEALLKSRVLEFRTADFELLETMCWEPGHGVALLSRHLDRAARSARYFDIPFDVDRARRMLASVDSNTRQRIRVLVNRSGMIRLETTDIHEPIGRVRLAIDGVPVDRADPFLHHKTTFRQIYVEAAARHPDADDVVLVNDDGEITETTIANIAVLIDGEWLTPPHTAGCLRGVRRAELLDRGAIVEGTITIGDLRSADGIARFNAVRPWEECELI